MSQKQDDNRGHSREVKYSSARMCHFFAGWMSNKSLSHHLIRLAIDGSKMCQFTKNQPKCQSIYGRSHSREVNLND